MKLLEFIQQQFSEEQFSTYQPLPFHKPLKSDVREELVRRILRQKIFNAVCKDEMNALARVADEANIRIAFMKGLVLAEDLYVSPETRFFRDIDLLVQLHDLKAFLKACKTLEYSFYFMEDDETIDKGIEHSIGKKMHHYYEVSKVIYRNGVKIDIRIDVHTHVFSEAFHQIEIPYTAVTKSALSSSILFSGCGFENIYVLNKCNDLLALVLHTVKHFFEGIMRSMKNNEDSVFFKMRQLLDIDLFIEKYDIDYIALFDRAIEWNAVSELVFMCKIIEMYKPNEFKKVNLNEIYQKHRRLVGFVAYSIDLFIKYNFDNMFELLLLPSWNLAKYIVDRRPKIEYPIISCRKGNDYHGPQDSCFVIDEYADTIHNRFNTHHKDGRLLNNPNDLHCQGITRWTDEYLFFQIKVESSNKLNLKNSSYKGWTPTDSINFYFLKPTAKENQCFVRQIEIPLQVDDNANNASYGKPFIKVVDSEFIYLDDLKVKYTIWNEESFVYNFEVCGNDYVLEIGFKWDMLYDCISNKQIVFDINMVTFDDTPPRRNILAWASTMNYSDFHDITTFGCVKIVDGTAPVCLD